MFAGWIYFTKSFCNLQSNFLVSTIQGAVDSLIALRLNETRRDDCELHVERTALLHGVAGNGKRTLAKLACEHFQYHCPDGYSVCCNSVMCEWVKHERIPDEWLNADLLALCEFWSEDVQAQYIEDLTMLIKRRESEGKVTILTTRFDMDSVPNVPKEFHNVTLYVGEVFLVSDRCMLIQWVCDRLGLELPHSAVMQIATQLSGSSGSIIEQTKRVAKFAAENAAVPLTGNVIDYALKQAKA